MFPMHAPLELHVTSQPSSLHVIALQLPAEPPHVMSQKKPDGHCTEPPLAIVQVGVLWAKSQLVHSDGHIIEVLVTQ